MYNVPDNEYAFAIEPECKECEECGSQMTEERNAGVDWYRCDKCNHVVYKDDEYAEEARLDHITSEQFPNV